MRSLLQFRHRGSRRGTRRGFVALDVLWILVLLGLVVVLSLRGMVLVEKREDLGRLERELDAITDAVRKLAKEEGLELGEEVGFSEYSRFFDSGGSKRFRLEGVDPFGGRYGVQVVGEEAVAAASTIEALGDFGK